MGEDIPHEMDIAPLPGTSDEFFTNSFPEDKEGRYTLYKYDLLNRLVSVSRLNDEGEVEVAASYRYSHRNLRIERTDKAGTVRYVFDLDGNIIEEHRGDELIRYVFRRGKHLAKITPDGTYYYGTDRLGSTTVMFDGEGSVVWRGDVSPFGELVSSEGSIEERVKFTGKDYDEAAGLYYFNARWYDAELGRFTTEDPARDGLNWYVYVRNNPLRYVDPSGLKGIKDNLGPPRWEDRYEEYEAPMSESVRDRNEQESKDFYDSVEPALIQYTEEEIIQLQNDLNDANDSLSAKRTEVYDFLEDYREALRDADGLETDLAIKLIPIPGSPLGMTEYEIVEELFPELVDSYKDIFVIPGEIDVAVSEYKSLFRSRDSLEADLIGQAKLKWQ